MGSIPSSLDILAQKWLKLDRDPETRKIISDLLDARDVDGLRERLEGRIGFGTAGLRARMDAGFTRMNCVTVIQASKGLASYIISTDPLAENDSTINGLDEATSPPSWISDRADRLKASVTQRGIVIGRDARRNSDRFAVLTALAFISKGFRVWWFSEPIHTPLVPFAVQEVGAAAGVMITASHNPKDDNGYKVYWNNACQIIPPHDSGISMAIVDCLDEPLVWESDAPGGKVTDAPSLGAHPFVTVCDDLISQAYVSKVVQFAREFGCPRELKTAKFVYTPMHGTGLRIMERVLKEIGIADAMTVVAEQAQPDPNFPTVKFPNPEEKGALELAIATADREGIDLILASDPDADRFAAAERINPGTDNEQWKQFTGNEVGVLLAAHLLEVTPEPQRYLALLASTVSSQMMGKMAAENGVVYRETLTGFKWIGNTALSILDNKSEFPDVEVAFGYEEALGYMFSKLVPDKDSISAAVMFISAVARWKDLYARGDPAGARSPYEKLEKLRKRYGFFAEANTYVISPSSEVTAKTFYFIRLLGNLEALSLSADPAALRGVYPDRVGRFRLKRWCDLTLGYDSAAAGPEHTPSFPVSRDAEMISCELSSAEDESAESDIRFTIRASGTEPKIKIYVEARSPRSMEEAQTLASEVQKCLIEEWLGQI